MPKSDFSGFPRPVWRQLMTAEAAEDGCEEGVPPQKRETVERSALVDLTDALLTAVRSRRCFTLRPE